MHGFVSTVIGALARRVIASLSVILVCGAAPLVASAAPPPSPAAVLMLYSYGDGGKGVEIFHDEFLAVMNNAGISVNDLFFEYLDLERNKDDKAYRAHLRDLLLEKYSHRNIGVVITNQQPALDFLLHEGRQIAAAAPAITIQAPTPSLAEAQGRRIVSQISRFDIEGTLERALELFPQTRHVVFISGSSEADRKVAAEAVAAGARWQDKIEFETTSDLSLEQMLGRAAGLPPRSVIVFTQYNRDGNGRVASAYEISRRVAKAANAPVFGLYDVNLANGGIGGSVVNVKALGQRTGQMALDILDGKLQLTEPIMSLSNPAVPMFDWSQIERWGGDASSLPRDSIFVNRVSTLWEKHQPLIIGSAIFFLAQSLTIFGLIVNRRRRMVAEKLVRESEERCRIKCEHALEHKRQYEEGLELLLELNQRAGRMTEQQICEFALDVAVKVTKSSIGYLHLVSNDQNTISLVTWNALALENCTAVAGSHYPLETAGIWADSARLRKPVLHNDYQNMPDKKTCPAGHSHLIRHMSTPALDGDKVCMIIGVGNKESDYVDEDARQLQLVANEVQKIVMKRRTEEALRESEARFRFIADLSPALVWVADESKLCTWFNKTWLDFTGRDMAQEMGNGWTAGIHPEDFDDCFATYVSHFDARRPFSMEFRLKRRDGDYRWVLDVGQPMFDENGSFKGYVGSCLDVSEQRAAEGKLRILWLAVQQSPSSIIVTDLDANIEYVNRAFRHASGYDRADVLGRNPSILQSGQTPTATYAAMWAALRRGDSWEGEFINKRKNGEIYTELARISPVRQPDGRITHYVAIKEDITERKHSEDAIRASKLLLQCVIDSTPDWIYVKDSKHRFMLVNQSFATAFNQTPEDMVGCSDTDFLPLDMCDGESDRGIASLHDDDDAIFNGESIHNPYDKVFFADGEIRVFDTLKGPLRDPSQRVYGNLTYRRDITERYHTEQEQRMLERQLRQAQKMELIGHLTGGIAHDFNNILAAMFGYAELAQMAPAVKRDPQLSLYLQEILQAGIRARELVSQLLTFSRKKDAVTEPIVVAPIVKEVTKLLRSTMPTTVSIKTTVAKGLPAALISSVHLHQVLMNLGINARDAMESKGTVEIRAEQVLLERRQACDSCHMNFSGRYVMIAVNDTGAGIPPENLLKIFDPFFTTKDVGRGSGLGLSVLHGIVHSANGHIEVRTALGQGTEFRIYLPAQSCEADRPLLDVEPEAENAQVRGHVLVVDDEPTIVGFMTALLENLGCTVTGVTCATEAWQLFQDDPYGIDMVITDQTMPDMTGVELARAMLARRPDLPIVLSTGYGNTTDEDTARRIGIRRFLMKPVPAKILSDVVAECLAEKKPLAPARTATGTA